MPVKPLPPNASLDNLKRQAENLIRAHVACDSQAAQRLREFHPRMRNADDGAIFVIPLPLEDAQLTIARERGFATWAN